MVTRVEVVEDEEGIKYREKSLDLLSVSSNQPANNTRIPLIGQLPPGKESHISVKEGVGNW